jgi:hypothetical protein
MFPRFLMPETMQKAGLLTINVWAIDGFTKVFWRDEPLSHLWPQVLVAAAMPSAAAVAKPIILPEVRRTLIKLPEIHRCSRVMQDRNLISDLNGTRPLGFVKQRFAKCLVYMYNNTYTE